MRTVTFSDAAVAKAVNDKFVATWVNRQPGFHNCEYETEKRIRKYEYECFATKNFCTFFTTPDLDVLHYASGYSYPPMFLDELAFVHRVADSVLDLRHRYLEDARPEFAALHQARSGHHDREVDRIARLKTLPNANDADVFYSRRRSFIEGHRNLVRIHADLADRAVQLDGPVPLSAVFNDYKYSNGFEEVIVGDRNRKDPENPGMQ